MQLTHRAKQVDRQAHDMAGEDIPVEYWKGMLITLRHFFKKKATIKYPEEKRSFSKVFRGLQILNRDEEGRERCTACGLCAVACPAEAITMEAAERQPEKNIYTGKKNMQPNTRSICCAVFFAGFVKKLVRKMRSIFADFCASQLCTEKDLFIKKKIC